MAPPKTDKNKTLYNFALEWAGEHTSTSFIGFSACSPDLQDRLTRSSSGLCEVCDSRVNSNGVSVENENFVIDPDEVTPKAASVVKVTGSTDVCESAPIGDSVSEGPCTAIGEEEAVMTPRLGESAHYSYQETKKAFEPKCI